MKVELTVEELMQILIALNLQLMTFGVKDQPKTKAISEKIAAMVSKGSY